jgi:cellulose biosynthesis protein BcsQ
VKVVAVHNFKGGVGKTTTSVNLAFEAARSGERALLWDLDPQGAASYCLRVAPQLDVKGKRLLRDREALQAAVRGSDYERLDLLPADFSLRRLDAWLEGRGDPARLLRSAAEELGLDHEWLVVDCAPTLSALNESVFASADAVLVPTIPTVLSLRTVARLLAHLKPLRQAGLRVLPFLSMVDRRKALHRDVCAWVRAQPLGFLETEIPYASVVERASVERRPLGALAPSSPAARAFAGLLAEVRARLEADEEGAERARPREVRELVEGLERSGSRPGRAPGGPGGGSGPGKDART